MGTDPFDVVPDEPPTRWPSRYWYHNPVAFILALVMALVLAAIITGIIARIWWEVEFGGKVRQLQDDARKLQLR